MLNHKGEEEDIRWEDVGEDGSSITLTKVGVSMPDHRMLLQQHRNQMGAQKKEKGRMRRQSRLVQSNKCTSVENTVTTMGDVAGGAAPGTL